MSSQGLRQDVLVQVAVGIDLLHVVLIVQGVHERADGVVEVPKGPLPRGTGRHLVPAKATLPSGQVACVASIDASSGKATIFWRDAGDWKDVTQTATHTELLYSLA